MEHIKETSGRKQSSLGILLFTLLLALIAAGILGLTNNRSSTPAAGHGQEAHGNK